ncbi:MAG: hypothetical protein ABF479_02625, partial [Gluconacetobacter sp.]
HRRRWGNPGRETLGGPPPNPAPGGGGADAARAFILLWVCQRAAEIQCHTGMIPGPDVRLSDEIRRGCARDAAVCKMRRERGPLWPGDNAA